jgi:hypothetical protein
VQRLREDGHSDVTSQWLSSQYNAESKAFNFDVETAESLVRDFDKQDFWMQLGSLQEGVSVHMVQAGRNPAWEMIQPEVQHYAAQNHRWLQCYLLPDAGHWVHVDDLPGLLRIFDSVAEW